MPNNLDLVKVKCGVCDGSGVCIECKGEKKINIGILGEAELQCPLCHGIGKCKGCNGKGDIWVQDNNPHW